MELHDYNFGDKLWETSDKEIHYKAPFWCSGLQASSFEPGWLERAGIIPENMGFHTGSWFDRVKEGDVLDFRCVGFNTPMSEDSVEHTDVKIQS